MLNLKRILPVLLVGLLCFGVTLQAIAEEVLFLSPTRVDIDDKKRVQVINVTNVSDMPHFYKLRMQDYIMNEKGVTEEVETFEYSAKPYVRFVPRSISLMPGERQTVRIMARFTGDVEDGDFHTHLLFDEDFEKLSEYLNDENNKIDNKAKFMMRTSLSTGIPMTVRHGDVSTTMGMRDLKLIKDNHGRDQIEFTMFHEGNGQSEAYFDTYYVSPNGAKVPLANRSTVKLYREAAQRLKQVRFHEDGLPVFEQGGEILLEMYADRKKDAKPIETLSIPAIP